MGCTSSTSVNFVGTAPFPSRRSINQELILQDFEIESEHVLRNSLNEVNQLPDKSVTALRKNIKKSADLPLFPQSHRWWTWQFLTGGNALYAQYPQLYQLLLKKGKCPEKFDTVIRNDAPRTMPTIPFFGPLPRIGPGQHQIYRILSAYCHLDPEVGYTQGMNFIVALLLLGGLSEEAAFYSFASLMINHHFRGLYMGNFPLLPVVQKRVEKEIRRINPQIIPLLASEELSLPMLTSSWILSFLLSSPLPISTILGVCDLIFLELPSTIIHPAIGNVYSALQEEFPHPQNHHPSTVTTTTTTTTATTSSRSIHSHAAPTWKRRSHFPMGDESPRSPTTQTSYGAPNDHRESIPPDSQQYTQSLAEDTTSSSVGCLPIPTLPSLLLSSTPNGGEDASHTTSDTPGTATPLPPESFYASHHLPLGLVKACVALVLVHAPLLIMTPRSSLGMSTIATLALFPWVLTKKVAHVGSRHSKRLSTTLKIGLNKALDITTAFTLGGGSTKIAPLIEFDTDGDNVTSHGGRTGRSNRASRWDSKRKKRGLFGLRSKSVNLAQSSRSLGSPQPSSTPPIREDGAFKVPEASVRDKRRKTMTKEMTVPGVEEATADPSDVIASSISATSDPKISASSNTPGDPSGVPTLASTLLSTAIRHTPAQRRIRRSKSTSATPTYRPRLRSESIDVHYYHNNNHDDDKENNITTYIGTPQTRDEGAESEFPRPIFENPLFSTTTVPSSHRFAQFRSERVLPASALSPYLPGLGQRAVANPLAHILPNIPRTHTENEEHFQAGYTRMDNYRITGQDVPNAYRLTDRTITTTRRPVVPPPATIITTTDTPENDMALSQRPTVSVPRAYNPLSPTYSPLSSRITRSPSIHPTLSPSPGATSDTPPGTAPSTLLLSDTTAVPSPSSGVPGAPSFPTSIGSSSSFKSETAADLESKRVSRSALPRHVWDMQTLYALFKGEFDQTGYLEPPITHTWYLPVTFRAEKQEDTPTISSNIVRDGNVRGSRSVPGPNKQRPLHPPIVARVMIEEWVDEKEGQEDKEEEKKEEKREAVPSALQGSIDVTGTSTNSMASRLVQVKSRFDDGDGCNQNIAETTSNDVNPNTIVPEIAETTMDGNQDTSLGPIVPNPINPANCTTTSATPSNQTNSTSTPNSSSRSIVVPTMPTDPQPSPILMNPLNTNASSTDAHDHPGAEELSEALMDVPRIAWEALLQRSSQADADNSFTGDGNGNDNSNSNTPRVPYPWEMALTRQRRRRKQSQRGGTSTQAMYSMGPDESDENIDTEDNTPPVFPPVLRNIPRRIWGSFGDVTLPVTKVPTTHTTAIGANAGTRSHVPSTSGTGANSTTSTTPRRRRLWRPSTRRMSVATSQAGAVPSRSAYSMHPPQQVTIQETRVTEPVEDIPFSTSLVTTAALVPTYLRPLLPPRSQWHFRPSWVGERQVVHVIYGHTFSDALQRRLRALLRAEEGENGTIPEFNVISPGHRSTGSRQRGLSHAPSDDLFVIRHSDTQEVTVIGANELNSKDAIEKLLSLPSAPNTTLTHEKHDVPDHHDERHKSSELSGTILCANVVIATCDERPVHDWSTPAQFLRSLRTLYPTIGSK